MNKKAQIAIITSLIFVGVIIATFVMAAPKACNNGIDDDGDGLVDFPADPGCNNKGDNSETSSSLVCDNGVDETNDADALADFRLTNGDTGCTSATDNSEIDGECDDLLDNDSDGHIDLSDSKCTGFTDPSESPRDFCNDPDGGNNLVLQGTVSGEDDSIAFSYTDYCYDSYTLVEYSCGWFQQDYDPVSTHIGCNSTSYCMNGACV